MVWDSPVRSGRPPPNRSLLETVHETCLIQAKPLSVEVKPPQMSKELWKDNKGNFSLWPFYFYSTVGRLEFGPVMHVHVRHLHQTWTKMTRGKWGTKIRHKAHVLEDYFNCWYSLFGFTLQLNLNYKKSAVYVLWNRSNCQSCKLVPAIPGRLSSLRHIYVTT